MPKVKSKYTDDIFTVYGAREVEYTVSDYECSWHEKDIELLLYRGIYWEWHSAKDYEPFEY